MALAKIAWFKGAPGSNGAEIFRNKIDLKGNASDASKSQKPGTPEQKPGTPESRERARIGELGYRIDVRPGGAPVYVPTNNSESPIADYYRQVTSGG